MLVQKNTDIGRWRREATSLQGLENKGTVKPCFLETLLGAGGEV